MQSGPTYRQWLQDRAYNGSDYQTRTQAQALLQTVGDDGKLDANFMSNPYLFAESKGFSRLDGQIYGYGPQGMNSINDIMYEAYNSPNRIYSGQVLGDSTSNGTYSGSGAYTSSGTTSTQPKIDAATIAGYDTQIGRTNDALGRIGGQKGTALSNLLGQFDNQKARLKTNFDDTEADYTRDVNQTTAANARKKSMIGDNVRANVNALQRLLGARGAGSSSASQIMAPYAASRAGTSERNEANETFATNMNALDTNFKRFKREWDQNNLDLETGYNNSRNEVESGFASKEAELRAQLATLQAQREQARGGANVAGLLGSQTSTITDLLNKIDQLATQSQSRVLSAKDAQYVAPELSQYNGEMRGVEASSDPTFDETSFYYPTREEEEKNRLLA